MACALMCIGQFYLTDFLNEILNDKLMTFAAMCMASFFCSNAFCRYTDSSIFVLYSMRWLPCEICAFIAGVAALRVTGPILQNYAADTDEETEAVCAEKTETNTENIETAGQGGSVIESAENAEEKQTLTDK